MDKKDNLQQRYIINGVQYEVSREFSEAVPLQELLCRELAEAIKRNSQTIDQAANL